MGLNRQGYRREPQHRDTKKKSTGKMDWSSTVLAMKGVFLFLTSGLTIGLGQGFVSNGDVSSRDPWFIASQILAVSAPAGWIIDRMAALFYENGHKEITSDDSVAMRASKVTKREVRSAVGKVKSVGVWNKLKNLFSKSKKANTSKKRPSTLYDDVERGDPSTLSDDEERRDPYAPQPSDSE